MTYIGPLKLHRQCLLTGACIWIYKANCPPITHHPCLSLPNQPTSHSQIMRAHPQSHSARVLDAHRAALRSATTILLLNYAAPTLLNSDITVLNLSKTFSPSAAQLSLLERGLTFIPSPSTVDSKELRRDVHQYHRRIKIMDYFSNATYKPIPFTHPSTWEPEWSALSNTTKQLIKEDLATLSHYQPTLDRPNNLTEDEHEAAKQL